MQALEDKSSIRRRMLDARRSMEQSERESADASIRRRLEALPQVRDASLVAAYTSDGFEPDIAPLLESLMQSGVRACLPRSSSQDYEMAYVESPVKSSLVPGQWGILEPGASAKAVPSSELSSAIWLVPGLAFDANGGRLGRGKGVYDRLLGSAHGFSIGVFYEFQRCGGIPMEGHDRGLDMVVTEAGVMEPSRFNQTTGV